MSQQVLVGLNSIKTHDAYTFQHSIDVTIMGVVLAKRAGWDPARVRLFGIGCMLHDIGKVFIPEELLRKPGRLTEAEFACMKQHPKLGYDLIKTIAPLLGGLVPQVAYQHHERQDGSGYPRGLSGTNTLGKSAPGTIHDFGSLSAVADVYDAMASMRPYRNAWAPDQVVRAVVGLAGHQLNRDAVEIFRSVVSPYPVCSEVVVLTGAHAGCLGVVAKVDPAHLERPVVRVIFAASGTRMEPVEIDLRENPDVVVRSAMANDELPADSMGGCRQEPRKAAPLPDEVLKAVRQAKAATPAPPKRLAS
jgi:HD-GYP domain-containing protein (c-di-GMP phosphodiesterase class II)